jgi:hypothetical protein
MIIDWTMAIQSKQHDERMREECMQYANRRKNIVHVVGSLSVGSLEICISALVSAAFIIHSS